MNKKIFKDIKLMVYDIETLYLSGNFWSLGKQIVRHHQLSHHRDMTEIICITYMFNDGKGPQALVFDPTKDDSAVKMIEEFDELVKECDVVIGKNSNRFDAKHINMQRLMSDLPPCPEWLNCHDDIEVQMRRYFKLPSQGLDFWSKKLGFGGKVTMQWSDWKDIEAYRTLIHLKAKGLKGKPLDIISDHYYGDKAKAILKVGKKSLDKMVYYGKKDVKDTYDLICKLAPHVNLKLNIGATVGPQRCKKCGSAKITEQYRKFSGSRKFIYFYCKGHNGSAGRISVRKDGTYDKNGILR